MSIYSNDNISKIAKLTTREVPHLAKTVKITVRENNGVYSMLRLLIMEHSNTVMLTAAAWMCGIRLWVMLLAKFFDQLFQHSQLIKHIAMDKKIILKKLCSIPIYRYLLIQSKITETFQIHNFMVKINCALLL